MSANDPKRTSAELLGPPVFAGLHHARLHFRALAKRAMEYGDYLVRHTIHGADLFELGEQYGDDDGKFNCLKPLAEALPKPSCEGAKRLTDHTRERLRYLVSTTARP